MKRYLLLGGAVVMLLVMGLGCVEEPLIPEDLSVLKRGTEAEDEDMLDEIESEPEDASKFDPDRKREKEQKEKEKEEIEKKEQEAKTADEKAVQAMDKMGELINEGKFEEAAKVFDKNKEYIEKVVEDVQASADAEKVKLWEEWKTELYKVHEILVDPELDDKTKKSRADNALSSAGLSRVKAKRRDIFER